MRERGLEAVLFDAGNTLLFVAPERMRAIFARHGVEVAPERFVRAELAARLALTRRLDALERPTGTEPEPWREYFGALFAGCGVPEEALEAVGGEVRRVHAEEHLWTGVDPRTPDALAALREDGYRLGVISNADGRIPALLERVGLAEHFEVVVDSARVGVEKPDPAIFHRALDALDLPADACIYTGDLYAVDVEGARRVGMRPLLLDPWDAFAGRDVERIGSVVELPAWLRGGDDGTPPHPGTGTPRDGTSPGAER